MGRLIDACKVIEKINGAIELLGIASKTAAENEGFQTTIKAYKDVRDAIMQEPTAEPERKTGRWAIRETAYESIEAKCSCCGFETLVDEPGNGLHMVDDLHYCPNCGARMEGNNETD